MANTSAMPPGAAATYSVTPAQILQALNLSGGNSAAASAILGGSQLQGIGLAALGMLLKNETGDVVANAYAVSPPISGGAAGNSGWTIGITQLDFKTNPGNSASPGAQQLLISALTASNLYNPAQATAIATAFTNAGSSPNPPVVNGQPVNITQINNALSTPAAHALINANADASVSGLMQGVDATVAQLTGNPTAQAALTPGSSTFNPTAYLALIE